MAYYLNWLECCSSITEDRVQSQQAWFFSDFLFATTYVESLTAVIFFPLILHSTVPIYEIHKFIISNKKAEIPHLLLSLFLWILAKVFTIWSTTTGYEIQARRCKSIRNGEIFWLNNNICYCPLARHYVDLPVCLWGDRIIVCLLLLSDRKLSFLLEVRVELPSTNILPVGRGSLVDTSLERLDCSHLSCASVLRVLLWSSVVSSLRRLGAGSSRS